MSDDFQKTIWFMWLEGIDNAPPMIHGCLKSWRYFNPDWEIRIIDRNSLADYLDLAKILGSNVYRQMEVQALSNIIRMNLLEKYGGVWTDATVLCRKPLEGWLPPLLSQRFFAFHRPARGRLFATWFFYGDPQSEFLKQINAASNWFWRENPYKTTPSSSAVFRSRRFKTKRVIDFSGKELSLDKDCDVSMIWGETEIREIFKAYTTDSQANWDALRSVHPYFWLHYIADCMVQTMPEVAAAWDEVPFISADIPHFVQHFGMQNEPSEQFIRIWDGAVSPMYKLDMWQASLIEEGGNALEFALDEKNWPSKGPRSSFWDRVKALAS